MKLVLCLGKCSNGKFAYFNVFIGLLNWIYNTHDGINIYLTNNKKVVQILKKLGFSKLSSIDNSNAIIGYGITDVNKYIFDYLKTANYNIDNGIKFIHFLKNNTVKVEIQVEDYNNFAILNITNNEEKQLKSYLPFDFNNKCVCSDYASDIDDIVEGEDWRAV